jgi:hypothetical protein
MIKFTCTCGMPLREDEQHAGQQMCCPACGDTLTVPLQAPATSGKAIAALVLGLLSLGLNVLTGLPALVFGARALTEIGRSRGRLGGKALAVTGMVLSALSLLVICPALIYQGYLWRVDGKAKGMSANNLRILSIAMHRYHNANGTFPPAQSPRDWLNPKPPKVSWRVWILRDMGRDDLFNMYQFNEPWDGPHNLGLLQMMPEVYELPGDTAAPPGHTYYQVFVSSPSASPHALFSPTQGVRIVDIKDGAENTLMIVEAATPVPWTKPDDITFDPNGPLPPIGKHFNGGCNAIFADGTVHFLPGNLPPATLRALITRDGGETVNPQDF